METVMKSFKAMINNSKGENNQNFPMYMAINLQLSEELIHNAASINQVFAQYHDLLYI